MKVITEEIRAVKYDNHILEYTLLRKNVKNINLRINRNESVCVSANRRVSAKYIDDFVVSKAQFINSAILKYKEITPQVEHTAEECRPEFEKIACEIHKRFINSNIYDTYKICKVSNTLMPQIKIRKMKSRWGSCIPTKGIITLSTHLFSKPTICIEYVILHEFCHFVHPNHSKDFYAFVETFMPDWKERKKLLEN